MSYSEATQSLITSDAVYDETVPTVFADVIVVFAHADC